MTDPSPAPPDPAPISPGGPVTGTETPLDLDAVEARASAATEGTWIVDIRAGRDYTDEGWTQIEVAFGDGPMAPGLVMGDHEDAELDAEFIAAARTDVPALIAEVRSLRDKSPLFAAEEIALTVALAQVERGEQPTPNVTALCIYALARVARGGEATE
jgi:hypothetical protein